MQTTLEKVYSLKDDITDFGQFGIKEQELSQLFKYYNTLYELKF